MINIEQNKRRKQKHKMVINGLFLAFFISYMVSIPIYAKEGETEGNAHEFQLIETVEATCTTEGFYHYQCNRCSMEYTTTKAKLGHHYVMQEQLATCTNDGKRIYTCDRCDDSYNEITQPIQPHEYATEVVKVANDTEEGIKRTTCKWCGTQYEEQMPSLGHDYQVEEVAATCTQSGERYYRCRRCADTYVETVAPILAHHYKSEVIKEVSTTEEGIRLYICTICGKNYEEKIQVLQQELNSTSKPEEKETLLIPEEPQMLTLPVEGEIIRPARATQVQAIQEVIKKTRPIKSVNYLIRGVTISMGILFLLAIISDLKLLLWYRNKKKKRRQGL